MSMVENASRRFARPPVSEMAIAVQLASPAALTPSVAMEIYDAVRGEFPQIEIYDRAAALGMGPAGGGEPQLVPVGVRIDPRWWFVSSDNHRLLQVQNDIFSFNWRRMAAQAQESIVYPGFEAMSEDFERSLSIWLRKLNLTSDVAVSSCSVYYENIWPVPDEEQLSKVFSFWRAMGIQGKFAGPEVRFGVILDEPDLGETARLDVVAGVGQMLAPTPIRAARLQLGGTGFPGTLGKLSTAIPTLHTHISAMFRRVIAPEMQAEW